MEKQELESLKVKVGHLQTTDLYDYIANNYHDLSKETLKEFILGCLYVTYTTSSKEDYIKYELDVITELENRL